MTHSMSRIDNGPMESFWGTLKCEKYYLHKFKTFEDLSFAIDDYIRFYNHERYQQRLMALTLSNIERKPLKSFLLFPLST